MACHWLRPFFIFNGIHYITKELFSGLSQAAAYAPLRPEVSGHYYLLALRALLRWLLCYATAGRLSDAIDFSILPYHYY